MPKTPGKTPAKLARQLPPQGKAKKQVPARPDREEEEPVEEATTEAEKAQPREEDLPEGAPQWLRERMRRDRSWRTASGPAPALDPYTGGRVLEYVTKYRTATEDETLAGVARAHGRPVAELLAYNNERSFGNELRGNSRLRKGTTLCVPGGPAAVEGTVFCTNYVLWCVAAGRTVPWRAAHQSPESQTMR